MVGRRQRGVAVGWQRRFNQRYACAIGSLDDLCSIGRRICVSRKWNLGAFMPIPRQAVEHDERRMTIDQSSLVSWVVRRWSFVVGQNMFRSGLTHRPPDLLDLGKIDIAVDIHLWDAAAGQDIVEL